MPILPRLKRDHKVIERMMNESMPVSDPPEWAITPIPITYKNHIMFECSYSRWNNSVKAGVRKMIKEVLTGKRLSLKKVHALAWSKNKRYFLSVQHKDLMDYLYLNGMLGEFSSEQLEDLERKYHTSHGNVFTPTNIEGHETAYSSP